MKSFIILVAVLMVAGFGAARADELADLRAASDEWWGLWSPVDAVDLDRAAAIESEAVGFGYFGKDLRRVEDVEAWKKNLRDWLETLEQLDYYPIDRELKVHGDLGLEWGYYYERQVNKSGDVTRDQRGRYTFTWIRRPEGWRILSYHRSAMPSR